MAATGLATDSGLASLATSTTTTSAPHGHITTGAPNDPTGAAQHLILGSPVTVFPFSPGPAFTTVSDTTYGSTGSFTTFNPNNIGDFGPGSAQFDPDEASRVRFIHGILAAIAMVAFFPSGAMLVRLLPGRAGVWAHALTQAAGLALLVAAVGLGVQLMAEVREIGIDLVSAEPGPPRTPPSATNTPQFRDPSVNYHPIIGLVVLFCLLVQPVLGLLHHAAFKRVRRRQAWSYLHLVNGRLAVTLGIANGALGLGAARATSRSKTAYVAGATAMWVLWMAVALWFEARRWWKARKEAKARAGAQAPNPAIAF